MRLIVLISLVLAGAAVRPAQATQETRIPPGCKDDRQQSAALPTGPFKFLPNESLKGHPLVKFQINADGTVSNVRLVRSCGVRDINKKVVESVSKWKYKPKPECGVVDVEMMVIIDLH